MSIFQREILVVINPNALTNLTTNITTITANTERNAAHRCYFNTSHIKFTSNRFTGLLTRNI
jgi:hypothetical protein